MDDPKYSFSDDRTHATVAVHIEEGIRYIIQDVVFQGDVPAEAQALLKKLRDNLIDAPYFRRRRLILRGWLIEIYGNLGYPDIVVEVREQKGPEPGLVVLAAEIGQGPHVTISDIIIRGNERTNEKFIRHRLLLKPGERFDLKQQQKSFRDFTEQGFFPKST